MWYSETEIKEVVIMRNSGKRYEEPKLNIKKVIAVILALVVIIMSIFAIRGILLKDEDQSKIVSKDYFVVFNDNKWGVIDSKGETVIEPSYEEMIVIPNSKRDIFLVTYDVNYETGEYKTKVLNSKNEEIFTEYESVEAIQNKDKSDNIWYEDNILKIKKDGKYGVVNFSGKQLTENIYDEIVAVQGIKSSLKVKKDDKYGIVNNEGKEIITILYTDILNLGKDDKAGYIVKNENGLYGVVDYSNKLILEDKYEEIYNVYSNDLYVVKKAGKQIVVKKDGTEVLTKGFDSIVQILKNTEDTVIFEKSSKCGVMKITGEIVIDATYDEIKEAKSGLIIAKQNEKYGVIDLEKNEKIAFKYNSIMYNENADIFIAENESFESDILDNNFEVKQSGILIDLNEGKGYIELRQGEEYKYYNFKFEEKNVTEVKSNNTIFLSKKDGKYGFVDKNGNVVVEYIYDDATEQNIYGFAGIKKDGKWGSIDNKGKVIQEPIYDLENYLKVDFVGKWHYGKDINMNYYTQM